jgi:hypothetical protein
VEHWSSFKHLALALILLIMAGLACGADSGAAEQLSPPGGTIPTNQEAADRLKQNFYQALQEASGNRESQLRVTNEEVTSLVAKELTETGQIPISEPQIWFTAGRIYITGKVKPFGPVSFASIIVATAVVDNGQLVVRVQEAQMGPFDFPDTLLNSITQTVNETLAGILLDLEIKRLEILEGEMFVVGTRRST